jgi:hypothetical protein
MSVGIQVGDRHYEIGAGNFLYCFFSTASANLEPGGWGTRFPALMNHLYRGTLPVDLAPPAKSELLMVQRELAACPPSAVVWDIEDRSQRPPWGDDIAETITSLANYFVTSDGRDLFEVLFAALAEAVASGREALIQ